MKITNIELKTVRLLLRPVGKDDAVNIFEYRSDKNINKYQSWIPKTINDVTEFIGKTSKTINISDTWFQFVILLNENEKLIGDIGVHFFGTNNKQVEIGFTLNKSFQSMGFATEALKCVIHYLFNGLNKHRIVTSIDPENINSIKLVERLGFRKEAHFKESILINGEWVDDLVYAILQKDYLFQHLNGL